MSSVASVHEPAVPSPISRLPVELLTRIFHHLTEMDEDDDLLNFNTSIAPAWFASRSVCRHWHAVISHYQPLVADLPLRSLPLTRAALELTEAGQYPLTFRATALTFRRHSHPDAVTVALQQLHRICDLVVDVGDRGFTHMEALCSGLAPGLKLFAMYGSAVPDEIFQGKAPQAICTLHLVQCSIRATNSLLLASSLTTLKLDTCSPRAWERVEDIAEALAGLPLLEEFYFKQGGLPMDIRRSRTTVWGLKQLRHLTLHSDVLTVQRILRRIRIPKCLSVALDCNLGTPSAYPEISPALATILDPLFPPSSPVIFDAVYIFQPQEDSDLLYGRRFLDIMAEHASFFFSLNLRDDCDARTPNHFDPAVHILPFLLPTLPRALRHTTQLSLSHPCLKHQNLHLWTDTLVRSFRHTTKITVTGPAGIALARLLGHKDFNGFPRLNGVCFSRLDMHAEVDVLLDLAVAAQHRSLDSFELRECRLADSHIRLLEKVYREAFQWDGILKGI